MNFHVIMRHIENIANCGLLNHGIVIPKSASKTLLIGPFTAKRLEKSSEYATPEETFATKKLSIINVLPNFTFFRASANNSDEIKIMGIK